MISLGRRDAREDLGLGFGSEREMEDTELEEGEACSYHNINTNNDDDYDESIDPDTALSYIDEKLQDVLGHFQKDFEGGVSAENLGAKFGGYGSFLPTYQRSPVWSHPRTSPKIQHFNASRSPNHLQLEGGRHSSVSSSTASQSLRIEPSSTVLKTSSSLNESVKQEANVPSTQFAEEVVPRDESVNRKCASLPDQKMLKVRIKVGSDNLSTQKNAAIYSGLGLDVSPSSSLDDSPSESDEMSHEPQDARLESPAHILQIMTSFPVPGGLLLSPLHDDLIHLKEKEKLLKDSECLPVPRFGPENSCIVVNGSSSVKGDDTMFGEKKIKSIAGNEPSAESKSNVNKDSGNGGVISKETELDTFACEELVSNTLKLPLLSNSYSAVVGTSKGMRRASNVSKGMMSDKGFSGLTKEDSPVPILIQENGWINNSKSKSLGKVWEDKKTSTLCSESVSPKKDGDRKGEKPYESVKSDSNVSKGRKAPSQAPTEPPKQNPDEKAMPYEQEGMKLPHVKESCSEGKKKLKGSQSHGIVVAEAPKESLRVGSSLSLKNKKISCADKHTTKGESEDLKLKKNSGKAGDRYREFFGDIELEQEEIQTSPLVKNYDDKLGDLEMVEKSTHGSNSMFKERSSSKKVDKLLTSEAFPKAASIGVVRNGDGPIPDTALGEDNWVCCDKCQKWRLLPPRTNPDDLPEKWLCSMLDWLPGMNRCSFSEDETTLATRSLKQNNSGGNISGVTMADVWNADQSHQNLDSHVGLRKKHGLKELPNITYKEGGPIRLSNPAKKSLQVSATNGSLNDVKPSPLVTEPLSLKLSKSSHLAVEKLEHKPREKHRGLDICSDRGGGSKRSKGKGKRDLDQDSFKAAKKIRTEDLPEDWTSDHGGAIEKVGPTSSNALITTSSGKNLPKHNDCAFKNIKHDQKDWAQLSSRKPKDGVCTSLDNGSVDVVHCDDKDTKKRRVKESYDAQLYHVSLSNTGHHLQDSNILAKEELSGNDYRKGKKARVSRSEGKEASGSKSNGRTDKKGCHRKNQQQGHDLGSNLSQQSLDGVDSLKRDVGLLHLAATSSSSKVSSSHKTKANFHDAKGSPVESVSSSPMRVSKPEKLASARKNVTKQDDSADAGFFALGGPRRFSDREDDGGSDPSLDDKTQIEKHHLVDGSHPRKSGNGSSSRSKDKNRNFNSEFENEVKVSNSFNAQAPACEVKPTNCKNKAEVKLEIKSEENQNKHVDKDSAGQLLSDNSKRENQLNVGGPSCADVKVDGTRNHDTVSTAKQSVEEPSSGRAQNETLADCPYPNPGSHEGNRANMLAVNASAGDNELKGLKQNREVDHPNGMHHHHSSSRNASSNGHRVRDHDAPGAVKRDSFSQAANNALKEAKNLKHMADRLKNSGSNLESTRLYFEAALKFLHGASLLETCGGENAKNGEPMQVYSSTAKLCEFCAHEYEKSKDMAAAALAYKCMEVAYMRAIYSSHTSANRDRHELQMALQIIPPGESPSSSASDIDNLNNTTTPDKVPLTKGIGSPQVTGSHIIAARNRPNFVRLLRFVMKLSLVGVCLGQSTHETLLSYIREAGAPLSGSKVYICMKWSGILAS
ncbi:hypothetical protein H0E87_005359 [Populus deltoides]|uniref:CW-type domain-containing protein n=1 Tax=Populus deltoides TaxID=3696 RepID=A0A8T2ZJB0_POPDE|nr:hypothetical protein H0E87_005359 [Populus deltoides]